jgi:hypothetical protein
MSCKLVPETPKVRSERGSAEPARRAHPLDTRQDYFDYFW